MSTEEVAATPVQDATAPTTTTEPEAPSRPTRSKSKSSSPVKKSAPASASEAKPRSTTTKPKSAAPAKKSGPGSAAAGSENKSFKVDDIVLARLKGYPPWPARIADPESASKAVRDSRPGKSNQVYLCHYFPAGDFSWCNVREINHLKPADIEDYLSAKHRKMSSALREAYVTAQDPSEWLSEQQEIQREKDEDVDELADEDEEEDEQAGGKRKRAGAGDKKKAAKKAKGAKKEEPAAKSKAKPKKATAPVSAPENAAPADDDPLASDPECVKVKDWRHKLQRAFLGKSLPTAPEMDSYHEVFNTIESYKDMTIEALQYSKIGKVMKKIATLDGIPRNDELKITERASKLMNEWHDFIASSNGANGTNGDAPKSEAKAAESTKAEESESKPAEEAAAANGTEEKEKMEVDA